MPCKLVGYYLVLGYTMLYRRPLSDCEKFGLGPLKIIGFDFTIKCS